MSMTPLLFRLLIPIRDSGCTLVCVTALLRLVTAWGLPFLPVRHAHGVFSSASSGFSKQRIGQITRGFPLICPVPSASGDSFPIRVASDAI
jgi:hypothetical protein